MTDRITLPAMKWISSSVAFGVALWAALLVANVIDVYILDHFDGAVGSRIRNIILNAALEAGLSLVAAIGFASVLASRRQTLSSFPHARLWLPIAAIASCVLIYSLTFLSPLFWDKIDSLGMNLVVMPAYCLVVGALTAAVLAWVLVSLKQFNGNAG